VRNIRVFRSSFIPSHIDFLQTSVNEMPLNVQNGRASWSKEEEEALVKAYKQGIVEPNKLKKTVPLLSTYTCPQITSKLTSIKYSRIGNDNESDSDAEPLVPPPSKKSKKAADSAQRTTAAIESQLERLRKVRPRFSVPSPVLEKKKNDLPAEELVDIVGY
jgi:hypothetical protein